MIAEGTQMERSCKCSVVKSAQWSEDMESNNYAAGMLQDVASYTLGLKAEKEIMRGVR